MNDGAFKGLIRLTVGFLLLGVGIQESHGDLPRVPGDQMSAEQIEKGAAAVHPATLYLLAERLFAAERKDEAVFWFYVGQLRYRFYLEANPKIDPSGDPALFSSLSEVIGSPLNRYAFQDRAKLVSTLKRVAEWDEKNPNGFTSKENNHAVWLKIRASFERFIEDVGSSDPGKGNVG